jgi:hypothetical protein
LTRLGDELGDIQRRSIDVGEENKRPFSHIPESRRGSRSGPVQMSKEKPMA